MIKVRKGFENYLLVAQGGRLNAEGTAAKPITFTADADGAKAGYWSGIIMNGLAPISGAQKGTTGKTEIDNSYIYGGTNADDNSSVLSYVKILYSGAKKIVPTLSATDSHSTLSARARVLIMSTFMNVLMMVLNSSVVRSMCRMCFV